MRNEIEELLFDFKDQTGIEITLEDMDTITEQCLNIAKVRKKIELCLISALHMEKKSLWSKLQGASAKVFPLQYIQTFESRLEHLPDMSRKLFGSDWKSGYRG